MPPVQRREHRRDDGYRQECGAGQPPSTIGRARSCPSRGRAHFPNHEPGNGTRAERPATEISARMKTERTRASSTPNPGVLGWRSSADRPMTACRLASARFVVRPDRRCVLSLFESMSTASDGITRDGVRREGRLTTDASRRLPGRRHPCGVVSPRERLRRSFETGRTRSTERRRRIRGCRLARSEPHRGHVRRADRCAAGGSVSSRPLLGPTVFRWLGVGEAVPAFGRERLTNRGSGSPPTSP